ncbi:DUF2191 domain-containing protein [Luteolibacter sp. Populi]|uniref:DUF2191 domain-containing protein n=1 Tax=Luteolibacter sp. Populi TaxID=3230487 RepID=UPI003465EF94
MRLTIDIEEKDLEELMDLTGERKKGPAVIKAALEFARREKIRDFTKRVIAGEFDYPLTNDDLEAADMAELEARDGVN